jgi:hypothetical protein
VSETVFGADPHVFSNQDLFPPPLRDSSDSRGLQNGTMVSYQDLDSTKWTVWGKRRERHCEGYCLH